ncbi:glycosyltransferase [Verrucomicrobiota bacterium]
MRIAHISTYPPIECGIGTYTQFFVDAMEKTPNEIHVISQYGARGKDVSPAYDSGDGDLARKIFNMTIRFTPDIIHFQHEFGLYGEMNGIAILDLINRFRSTGAPTIATLHTVLSDPSFRCKMIIEEMCRCLSSVIVHEESHLDLLTSLYGADPSKINVIPHGARTLNPIKDAKKKLQIEGLKTILLIGYFRPTKCFDRIVDIFPAILEKSPDTCLIISGKLRMLEYSEYRELLFDKIDACPAKDRIQVFRGQFPQKTFDTIVSAGDVLLFPYSAGAQSGVMAHALAFGKPVVTSDLPAFRNIVQKSGAGFFAGTDEEYVEKIAMLLNDDEQYRTCSENALKYVNETISWDIVVQKTLAVYKKFDIDLPRTRYVYVDNEQE